jgi:hypothetical protein
MSVQATSWVIENSIHKGSALLLLMMIANHAHADGTNAFPSIETLAKECRMSTRQISRLVDALEGSGELIVERSPGRKAHNYAIKMSVNTDKMSGLNNDKLSRLNGDKMSGLKKGNHDKSPSPTMTNRAPNHDKFDGARKLQNKELLINHHEPSCKSVVVVDDTSGEKNSNSNTTDSKNNFSGNLNGKITEAWLAELQSSEAYNHLDVKRSYHKMVETYRVENRPFNRKDLIRWLNREWEAVNVGVEKKRPATGRQNGNRGDPAGWRKHYETLLRNYLPHVPEAVGKSIESVLRDFPTLTFDQWKERREEFLELGLELV